MDAKSSLIRTLQILDSRVLKTVSEPKKEEETGDEKGA